MRKTIFMVLLFSILLNANELAKEFEKYPTKVYNGELLFPQDYQCDENNCKDINYKIVDLSLNFAGKYAVVLHSCGTECRFYSMIDVTNANEDFEILSRFNTTPDTSSSKESIDILTHSKNSKLLIVQKFYSDDTCIQEKFILDDNALNNITTNEKCIK